MTRIECLIPAGHLTTRRQMAHPYQAITIPPRPVTHQWSQIHLCFHRLQRHHRLTCHHHLLQRRSNSNGHRSSSGRPAQSEAPLHLVRCHHSNRATIRQWRRRPCRSGKPAQLAVPRHPDHCRHSSSNGRVARWVALRHPHPSRCHKANRATTSRLAHRHRSTGYYQQSVPLQQGQQGYYQPSGPLPQGQPGYYPPVVQPVVVVQQQQDNSTLAIILEVIPGLFGIFGIGWMVSGYILPGILLLIGGIIVDVCLWLGAIFLAAVTLGLGAVTFVCPGIFNLVVLITSTIILASVLRKRSTVIVR